MKWPLVTIGNEFYDLACLFSIGSGNVRRKYLRREKK